MNGGDGEWQDKLIDECVKIYAPIMAAKLKRKAREGYEGFHLRSRRLWLRLTMFRHACELLCGDDDQAVDVATLAMFLGLHRRGKMPGGGAP